MKEIVFDFLSDTKLVLSTTFFLVVLVIWVEYSFFPTGSKQKGKKPD